MMRRALLGFLFAIPAYLLGAFGGGYLILLSSGNQHDRQIEAAMTGAFVVGPILAVIAFVVCVFVAKPGSAATSAPRVHERAKD